MTNELTAVDNNTDLITFDESKVGLIKRTVAKGATDDELELFLHQCRKTGLDPLANQIYFQKYNTKNGPQMTIITGIDGYRLVASRTGVYAGNDAPEFEGRQKYSGVDVPAKATVKVWRLVGGKRVPFAASVYWDEYVPSPPRDYQWKKMPHVMLAKCAEAAALRKAFPADLSGVYTNEEMQQADWTEIEPTADGNRPISPVIPPSGNESPFNESGLDEPLNSSNGDYPEFAVITDFYEWYLANGKAASYYASDSPKKANIHMFQVLKKVLGENVGLTFKQRATVDYVEALDNYANEKADKEAEG